MHPSKRIPYKGGQNLSSEQIDFLKQYLSSAESDIFALKGLEGVVGAAFARYSRQKGGVKETLLELVKDERIDPVKSTELIERILIQYGDDSVGELEGAHLALENISNLATKEIEDRRIGGSPIEQSSRYVVYDHKDENGNYRYYKDNVILDSPVGELYVQTMDRIFDTYCRLQEPLKTFFSTKKSLEEAEYDILGTGKKQRFSDMPDEKTQKDFKRTYNMDLKTKTCDTLRCMLPAATLTNMGIFGNGRFFQNLLSHLYSQELPEMRTIAGNAHQALNQVIPVFVKRAAKLDYIVQRNDTIREFAASFPDGVKPKKNTARSTKLLARPRNDREFLIFLCADILFPFTHFSASELRKIIARREKEMPGICKKIIDITAGNRQTRRDRVSRGYEYGYPFTYELVNDFGIYRDLERHRMLTQQRQLLTPYLGYNMPSELQEAGVEKEVEKVYRMSKKLFEAMREQLGDQMAQYAVCYGYHLRYIFGMNLRAIEHLTELRSSPQGHPNYRLVAQEMAALLPEVFKPVVRFVDYNNYFWARGDSEAKQRQKERAFEERQTS